MALSTMHATVRSPPSGCHISRSRTQRSPPVAAAMPSITCDRRAVLAASGASLLLLFSSSSAQAVNLNEAKRRSAERKLEVQKAAQEAAETGVAVETSLTSDKTVPESVQRGRNSRTGPLSNKE